jgi:hypothetical protein
MKAELQLNDKGVWRAHAIEAEDVFCRKAYDQILGFLSWHMESVMLVHSSDPSKMTSMKA